MEPEAGKFPDPLNDEIGKCVLEFRKHAAWTKEKHLAWAQVEQKLIKARYQWFWGRPQRYELGPKGDSYLYEVPVTQMGFLSAYQGHLVRLIVTAQSRHDRKIMVGLFNRDLLLPTLAKDSALQSKVE